MKALALRERTLGGLWGAIVGDALGVPVEFKSREELRADPVREMRGGGTWHQPPGTWSDDSSLLLCAAESLLGGFDLQDMARRFASWMKGECWTPWGNVFDVGLTTRSALDRIIRGESVRVAGGTGERSNGNGSLMRTLPLALRYWHEGEEGLLHRVHCASAITHAHPRAQMACGLYALLISRLLQGMDIREAAAEIGNDLAVWYDQAPFLEEHEHFEVLARAPLATVRAQDVQTSAYVVHTITAAVWCAVNGRSYTDVVLTAVNLGGDADTTAAVAGGLAGVQQGLDAVPERWRQMLARRDDIEALFDRFAQLCAREAPVL